MGEQERNILRKIADLITAYKKTVFCVYGQDNHRTKLLYNENVQSLLEVLQFMRSIGSEAGRELESSIAYLRETGLQDAILFADVMEKDMLPALEKCAYELGGAFCLEEENYRVEATSSGYLTLKKDGIYLHSNDNPMIAAWHLAKEYFDPEKESYAVLGCGLGYHLLELYRISMGAVKIYAYEPDEKMIEYGRRYGVLEEIPGEALTVVHDPDIMEFLLHSQNERTGICMHLPTIQTMQNAGVRKIAEELFVQWNTQRQFQLLQEINFKQNKKNCTRYLEDLPVGEHYEEAVVAAAGPSLDNCMEWLGKKQGKVLLIAVSTVFKKLLKAGIRPDFVAVMDPQERTFGHLKGMEQESVPLLIAPFAYWEFAKRYQGEKYLACFRENGTGSFQMGGTVTSLALEMAIYMQVKRIYLAGVDMAFPEGITHADGTMDRSRKDLSKLIPVTGVGGRTVYTDGAFTIYRKYIEQRIRDTPDIVYVNLSGIGARIEGTEEESV